MLLVQQSGPDQVTASCWWSTRHQPRRRGARGHAKAHGENTTWPGASLWRSRLTLGVRSWSNHVGKVIKRARGPGTAHLVTGRGVAHPNPPIQHYMVCTVLCMEFVYLLFT